MYNNYYFNIFNINHNINGFYNTLLHNYVSK